MTSDEASPQHLASFMTFSWNHFDVSDWIIVESGSICLTKGERRRHVSNRAVSDSFCHISKLTVRHSCALYAASGLVCGNVNVVRIFNSLLSCPFYPLHNFFCYFLCVMLWYGMYISDKGLPESVPHYCNCSVRGVEITRWKEDTKFLEKVLGGVMGMIWEAIILRE